MMWVSVIRMNPAVRERGTVIQTDDICGVGRPIHSHATSDAVDVGQG